MAISKRVNLPLLVGVMLVLLVIFILTVPVLTHSVKLQQPQIRIRGDRPAEYQHVTKLISQDRQAGITQLGFATEPGKSHREKSPTIFLVFSGSRAMPLAVFRQLRHCPLITAA